MDEEGGVIYLSRIGTVMEFERTFTEWVGRPVNPKRRSGVDRLEATGMRETLSVRLHPSGRTMPDFWKRSHEPVSFLRKVWRIQSVEAPEARGDGIALTIHLWRDFDPPANAKRKETK